MKSKINSSNFLKVLLFIIFLILEFINVDAQTRPMFFTKLNGESNVWTGQQASFEFNNNYYSFGNYYTQVPPDPINFLTIAKYNFAGDVQNIIRYDSFTRNIIPFPIYDYSQGLKPIDKFIFNPTYKSYGGYNMFTPCLIRIDTLGIHNLWDYTFQHPTILNYNDISADLAIYAQGESRRDTNNLQYEVSDGIIMKLDTAGNELWRFVYTPSTIYRNGPGGIKATADSGCVALFHYGPWPAYSSGRVVKLSKSGQIQWVKNLPFTGGIEELKLIDYDDDTKSLVTFLRPYNDNTNNYVATPIVKLNVNMQKEWSFLPYRVDSQYQSNWVFHYPTSARNFIKSSNGKGYIGCGEDKRDSTGKIDYFKSNGYIMYVNDSGKPLWEATYQSKDLGVKELYFNAINTTSDGGYLLTGSCRDSLNNQVGFLMKIDSLGCLSDDSCEARFFTSIRYYEPDEPTWSIYPNPAQDKLFVSVADAQDYRYTLADLQGRKLTEGLLDTEKLISIGHLEKGTYIVSLMDKKGNVFSKKVVRE